MSRWYMSDEERRGYEACKERDPWHDRYSGSYEFQKGYEERERDERRERERREEEREQEAAEERRAYQRAIDAKQEREIEEAEYYASMSQPEETEMKGEQP